MDVSLKELAQLVDGAVIGDGELRITGAETMREAKVGEITLAENELLVDRLADCAASAALVPRGLAAEIVPVIQVEDVRSAFAKIVTHFRPIYSAPRTGISSAAHVSESAHLEADVEVHPGAAIGDHVHIGQGSTIHAGVAILPGCQIDQNVTIYPGVVLYENSVVGARTIIHAGAVLGSYGFGYEFVEGRHELCAQLGNVEIGADVEIGAATTIDRASYGTTSIGDGTKIDNQVMIDHNCRIGKHNLICSQVGIAGSTTTGDYTVIAGQVGIRDHVQIGKRAVIGAKAGVRSDVPDGATFFGLPATPERDQKIKQAAFAKLPEMRKQLKALERTVKELSGKLELSNRNSAA